MGGDAAYDFVDGFAKLLPKSWRPKLTLEDFPTQSEGSDSIAPVKEGSVFVPKDCRAAQDVLAALASPGATEHVLTQFATSGALDFVTVGVSDVGSEPSPLQVMEKCSRLKWTEPEGTLDGRFLGTEESCKWKPLEGEAPTATSGVFTGTCVEYKSGVSDIRRYTKDLTVLIVENGDNALIVDLSEYRKLSVEDVLGIEDTVRKTIPRDQKVTRAGLVSLASEFASAFSQVAVAPNAQ